MQEGSIVQLDSLNAKQKAKEFKATQKELKSKDDAIKLGTIHKISKDLRYLSEGSCVQQLLLSVVAKKVRNNDLLCTLFSIFVNWFRRCFTEMLSVPRGLSPTYYFYTFWSHF